MVKTPDLSQYPDLKVAQKGDGSIIYAYEGLIFNVPSLKHDGFTIKPEKKVKFDDGVKGKVVDCLGTLWDPDQFEYVRRPVVVGEVEDRERFSLPVVPRVLDLLIKKPGEDYYLPLDLVQFLPTIQEIINLEHSINPHTDDYYCCITVDQGYVEPKNMQRNSGFHVDGYQGPRIRPKRKPITHNYIVSDCLPTVFLAQSLAVSHIDDSQYNICLEFDRLAKPENYFQSKPYQITLMDAYTVHSSAIATQKRFRTFLRATFTQLQFDRLGNSVNPLVAPDWDEWLITSVRANLKRYIP